MVTSQILSQGWTLAFAGPGRCAEEWEKHPLTLKGTAAPFLCPSTEIDCVVFKPPQYVQKGRGSTENVQLCDLSIHTTIPSYVQQELLKGGHLESGGFHENDNELRYRWIAFSNWTYSNTFRVEESWLNSSEGDKIFLELEGIDTISRIMLNGEEIGKTENMFLKYSFEIFSSLKSGNNLLQIFLESPLDYIEKEKKGSPYPYPTWEYPNGELNRGLIRKTGCHFGWDWGPCFVPIGIHLPIRLLRVNRFLINGIRVQQDHSNDKSIFLNASIDILSSGSGIYGDKLSLKATIKGENDEIIFEKVKEFDWKEEVEWNSIEIPRSSIDLWFPNGYGEQKLYSFQVSIVKDFENSKEISIGFRSLELIRVKDNEKGSLVDDLKDGDPLKELIGSGESFYFKINGRPIFSKGANWIPADSFSTELSNERLYDLLHSAKEANMNTIRVWGGGSYEPKFFYDTCDRLGLLVWHDLMFACSIYPATLKFLKNVEKEVEYQLKRLYNHPSIALWCANNENEDALGIWEECKSNRDRYVSDYHSLYILTIAPIVERLDPNRPFWPSSPTNGIQKWGNPQEQNKGDIHFWGVWHGNQPFDAFHRVKPRFCSEFGFQSFPSLSSLKKVISVRENEVENSIFNLTSPEMEFRQRSPAAGNKCMMEHVAREFKMPNDFDSFVYLSQISQAMAMKTGCEHFRRLKPYCMGEIYWQLNDIWEGPSWSSLEYSGSWKLLHYFAKKFFAPLIATIVFDKEKDTVEFWVTSDLSKPFFGRLRIEWWSWKENKALGSSEIQFNVEMDENKRIKCDLLSQLRIGTANGSISFNPKDHFMFIQLLSEGEDIIEADNFHFFCPVKQISLKKPDVKTHQFNLIDERTISFEMETDVVAPYVYLQSGTVEGIFNCNGFLLLPNKKVILTFKGKDKIDLPLFREQFVFRSLFDSF